MIISRFNMEQTIQNIKSILLIVGALGMILGALLIINIKNKGGIIDWFLFYKL
ncbi:hypothetical protein [Clostridium sp.]|uniref:hypothetical protein n=1 Tax=Clostridium sp. TaxID=1506 RepID=UPI0025C02A42|nr:hypothetical protein [Clostridium sp.]